MKKFLLGTVLLGIASVAAAEDQWVMVTDSQKQIPMASVECLLAADDAESFTILQKDNQSVTGVNSISFMFIKDSAVETVCDDAVSVLPDMINDAIMIAGAKGKTVSVYNLEGKTVLEAKVTSDNESINVSHLDRGVYVLYVGQSSIKFNKR